MEITSNSSLEETLNAFIADEHIASTQYKMAKAVAKGKALNFANKVFDDNGDEEDEHFDELVTYAQSLGLPVQVNPSQMEVNCTTPFVDMTDGDSTAQLVAILISAEKKAIQGYETALRNTAIVAQHPELLQFFGELLNDERRHLKELDDVLSNIEGANAAQTAAVVVDVTPPEQTDAYGYPLSQSGVGESVDRTNTLKILEGVNDGSIDPDGLVKNLVNYMMEESVAEFADRYDYFDTEVAKKTSPDDPRRCSKVLMEMVEDGMVESTVAAADMLDFMSDEDVGEFGRTVGYIKGGDAVCESADSACEIVVDNEVSFQEMFNEAVSR